MEMFKIDNETYINPNTISLVEIRDDMENIDIAELEFINNAELCDYFDKYNICITICKSLSIIVIADGKHYTVYTEICKGINSQLKQYFEEMEIEFENYPKTKNGIIKDNGNYIEILQRNVYQFLCDFTSNCGIRDSVNAYIDTSNTGEIIRKKLNIFIVNINESLKESK